MKRKYAKYLQIELSTYNGYNISLIALLDTKSLVTQDNVSVSTR